MRVLVISPERTLEEYLKGELASSEFEVVGTRPGWGFVETARRERVPIAIVDRADERREAASLELALLRDARPDVRVIVLSATPSPEDARLVEQGVFFYLSASPPVRLPDVIRAAARSIRDETEARTRQGELR